MYTRRSRAVGVLRNLTEPGDTCRERRSVGYGSCKQAISKFSYSSTAFLHHTISLGKQPWRISRRIGGNSEKRT
jgi:hypothetical protein